jgi:hypothetical protein
MSLRGPQLSSSRRCSGEVGSDQQYHSSSSSWWRSTTYSRFSVSFGSSCRPEVAGQVGHSARTAAGDDGCEW